MINSTLNLSLERLYNEYYNGLEKQAGPGRWLVGALKNLGVGRGKRLELLRNAKLARDSVGGYKYFKGMSRGTKQRLINETGDAVNSSLYRTLNPDAQAKVLQLLNNRNWGIRAQDIGKIRKGLISQNNLDKGLAYRLDAGLENAGRATADAIGRGATAARDAIYGGARAVGNAGLATGRAVGNAGRAVGRNIADVGRAIGEAGAEAGKFIGGGLSSAGRAVGNAGLATGRAVGNAGRAVGNAVGNAGRAVGRGATAAGRGAWNAMHNPLVSTGVGTGIGMAGMYGINKLTE